MKLHGLLVLALAATVSPGLATAQVQPAGKVFKATTITLDKDTTTVAAALAQINNHFPDPNKFAIVDARSAGKNAEITLGLKQAPFWEALDAVATEAKAGLSLYHENAIKLVDGNPPVVAPSYDSIFRSTVKRVAVEKHFDTGSHQCRLWLEVAWEPHFKPFVLELAGYETVFAPSFKQGPSLKAKGKVSRTASSDQPGQQLAFEVDWRMKAPPRSSQAIESLIGNWHIIGPEKMVVVVFDEFAKAIKSPQKKTVDDCTATLKKLSVKGSIWLVDIDLAYSANGPEFESFEGSAWLKHNEIYLQNKTDPKKILNAKPEKYVSRNTSNEASIQYAFETSTKEKYSPADWKLVYKTPSRIVEVSVPFAFKNIPLP